MFYFVSLYGKGDGITNGNSSVQICNITSYLGYDKIADYNQLLPIASAKPA